jgi:hypothetical protein
MSELKNFKSPIKKSKAKHYERSVHVIPSEHNTSVRIRYRIKGFWPNDAISVYAYYENRDGVVSIDRLEITYGSGGYDSKAIPCDIERMSYFVSAMKNAQSVAETLRDFTCNSEVVEES